MRQSNRGFVLLLALLFTQVYAGLGLAVMETALWQRKQAAQQKQQQVLEQEALRLLPLLAERNPQCVTPAGKAWQTQACLLSEARLSKPWQAYYVWQAGAHIACAQIKGSTQQAQYFRLYLQIISLEKIGYVWEASVVKASGVAGHCEEQPHSVDLGLQSLHLKRN